MLAPLRFRLAVAEDATAVVPIVNGAYRGDGGRHGWTSEHELVTGARIDAPRFAALLARPASFVLVAERDARIVGCVHLQRGEHQFCELGMLAVDVQTQGGGVGKFLMESAESFARERMGARVIVMHVISIRAELLAYYERRGYRRTGHLDAFVPTGGQEFLRGPLFFERLEKRLD